MSTIVTRAGKGSPLTNAEVDSNFTNLNTDKVESITSADGSVVVSSSGTTRDLSVGVAGSTATLISQVRNETGATLTKGTVVYISGAAGNKAVVSKAIATGDSTSAQTYGMVQADIPHNQNGYVVVVGAVSGLNTSAFADGTQLYLSGVSAGGYTNTKPYAPTHLVYVGIVTYSHNTQGTIQVKIQNGYELDEIHDVSARSPVDGQTLVYVSSTGLWTKTDQASMSVGSAATLATARNINGVSFNGSADITVADATKLPLAGGTLTGKLTLDGRNEVYGVPTNAGTIAGFMGGTSGGTTAARTQSLNTQTLLNVAAIGYTGSAWVGGAGLSFVATENITAANRGTKAVLTAIAAGDSVATTMEFDGSALTINGSTAVTSSNYTTYAPTKTGTGASGTWGINITGNAATATSATDSTKLPLAGGTLTGNVTLNTSDGEILVTPTGWRATDRAAIKIRSKANAPAEIDLRHTVGGVESGWHISARDTSAASELHFYRFNMNSLGAADSAGSFIQMFTFRADGSFNTAGAITQNGSQVLTAGNYNSYSPTLTGTGASGTWGINITGSAGSISSNGYTLTTGGSEGVSSGWIGFPNGQGIWSSVNGAHLVPNAVGTYGSWRMYGSRNGWHGLYFDSGSTLMMNADTVGFFRDGVGWQMRWAAGTGYVHKGAGGGGTEATILDSSNYNSYSPTLTGTGASGTWGISITGSAGSAGSVDYNNVTNKTGGTGSYVTSGDYRAPVFYDSNDTSFAVDPNATSAIRSMTVGYNGSSTAYGQEASGKLYFGSSGSDATDYYHIATTMQNYGGNYSKLDFKWYTGQRFYAHSAYGGFRFHEITNNTQIFSINEGGAFALANQSMRAPIFYDSDDTGYFLDPTSGTTSLKVGGALTQGSLLSRPYAVWGEGGTVTGAIVIKLPGTSPGNYGMIHAVIDIYEYNGNNVSTVTIGGHNWSTGWYNYGTNVTGYTNKPIRLCVVGGQYAIVIGNDSSTWEYGQVVLRKIQNGAYYAGNMNLGGTYSIYRTTSVGASWDSGDTNNFRSTTITGLGSVRAPIFYDSDNTGYYVDPAGSSLSANLNGPIVMSSTAWTGEVSGKIQYHGSSWYLVASSYFHFRNTSGLNTFYGDPSGNTWSETSSRAPTFYDSQNTGYYVDPNSTSNVLNMLIGASSWYVPSSRLVVGSGSGTTTAQISWESNGYYTGSVAMTSGGAFVWGGQGSSSWDFRINCTYNGDYSASGSSRFSIDSSGNSTSVASSRAPIFYDSQDTAFYCDPNGTTRLAALTVGYAQNYSTIDMYDGDEGTRYIHNNSGTIGFLNNGGSWRFRVADDGNVIMGTYQDWMSNQLRSAIFYDHSDTNYYVDPNSGSRLAHIFAGNVASSNDGGWNARMNLVGSSHARLDVVSNSDGIVTTMYSHTGQGVGKVGTYSNHPLILMAQGGNDGGSVYNGSLRSPIFYDSDNTAYFTNPAGRSRQASIDFGDGSYYIHAGSWGMRNTTPYGYIEFGPANGGHAHIYTDRSNFYFNAMVQVLGGSQINQSDIRANIFYDQQDTGYYADPNGTSNLNRLLIQPRIDNYYVGSVTPINPVSDWQSLTNVEGQFSVAQFNYLPSYTNSPASVYTYGAVISTRTQNHSFQLYAAHTGDLAYKTQWNNDNYTGWLYPMVYGRNNGTGGSVYGTVFYDGNDTGYYVDPNSNSRLVNLGLYCTPDLRLSVNGDAHISNLLYMGGTAGSYNSWGSRDYTTSGNRYFNANSFEFNNYGYGSTWTFTLGGAIGQISGSFRAPVFYDTNDTSYYLDPTSTQSLRTVGDWRSDSASWTGEFSGKIQYHSSNWYFQYAGQWIFRNSGGSNVAYGDTSGNMWATASMRSPIFYDSDNTGYYLDPASTSVLNRISTVRTNDWLYLDNNYGHSVVGVYDSYRYQGVFAMGNAYKLPADGTSTGGLYGMAWSHPNAGGAAGNLTDHGLLIINNGGFRCAISNSIVASANITAYSDERLKTNWRDMPEDYVTRLAKVKVGIYDRVDQEDVTQVGVSAQSFQELLPQAIMTAKDEMQTLSVSYGNAALASAVELAKEVVDLRNRVAQLESLITKLIGD